MKIIFLDIDGVLNCQKAYTDGFCKHDSKYGQEFYPPSKDLLNKLIDESGAKVVISSTWRHSGLQVMQEMWEDRNMSGEVIGITPSLRMKNFSVPRGCEIDYYLRNELDFTHINWDKKWQQDSMDKSGVENYIIIDDDSDMLYNQRHHFVHVFPAPRNMEGFNQEHYIKAKYLLLHNVIDLNYEHTN